VVGQDKEPVSAVSVLQRDTQADGHAIDTSIVAPGKEIRVRRKAIKTCRVAC